MLAFTLNGPNERGKMILNLVGAEARDQGQATGSAAALVFASKAIGGDYNYAWSTAEIAVMGAKGACEIIFRGDDDLEQRTLEDTETFCNPMRAAERGIIDAVIEPEDTRARIIEDLKLLERKQVTHPARRHSNIPL